MEEKGTSLGGRKGDITNAIHIIHNSAPALHLLYLRQTLHSVIMVRWVKTPYRQEATDGNDLAHAGLSQEKPRGTSAPRVDCGRLSRERPRFSGTATHSPPN